MNVGEIGAELFVDSAENLKDSAGDLSLLGFEKDTNTSVSREWLRSVFRVFASNRCFIFEDEKIEDLSVLNSMKTSRNLW